MTDWKFKQALKALHAINSKQRSVEMACAVHCVTEDEIKDAAWEYQRLTFINESGPNLSRLK